MMDESAMTIQDSLTKQDVKVESIRLSESYKLLGAPIAFDGNSTAQTAMLEKHVNHIIKVFNKVSLNHDDTFLGYNTVAVLKLNYMMPATTIPSHHLRKLQNKLTYNVISRIGFNRSFPREIIHAPRYFGGLAFYDMEQQQGISHISRIISHYRARTFLSIQYTQLIESYILLPRNIPFAISNKCILCIISMVTCCH